MLPITPNYKPHYINFSLLIFSIGFLFKVSAAPARQIRVLPFIWVKLLNSGNTLKILIPSLNRKVDSGCFNQTCKVTIQNIIERLMGYRGSKSVEIILHFVRG